MWFLDRVGGVRFKTFLVQIAPISDPHWVTAARIKAFVATAHYYIHIYHVRMCSVRHVFD